MSILHDVRPPPLSLHCNLYKLAAETLLHRIHDKRFEPLAFNPGLGNSRFAPFMTGGTSIPTAYCATSLDCAIFETIFHDIEPPAKFRSVRWSSIETLVYSTIKLKIDLELASLFSADLIRWGVARDQLIDTPKSTYPLTKAWSPAIHNSPQKPAGMIWTSRKFDEEKVMMMFGDRVNLVDLATVSSVSIVSDTAVLSSVYNLSRRAGIDIIR